ncbi:MAG: hypothetical protein HN737_01015 [Desulfobacterales bacterium]|jgi:hypothetical protein|nr:hypothetical protein [Desulfobacteraceae bacterium]MBT4363094.1 hypothetical protein [Desulfobacteraceae bacterium]MBT7086091.1 hypothetical protein [Desulfobacterales bacterium]MBT7695972.1 hypothetical protein [Desulfobacterales bacterium]
MKKILKWILGLLLVSVVTFLIVIKLQYGMGLPYPDVSGKPVLADSKLESFITLELPPGMVSSAPDGRLFFSYHTMHKPERFVEATIFEWVDGKAVPFPDSPLQKQFAGAMGINADQHQRLWIVIPGGANNTQTRLMAISTKSGELIVDHVFPPGVALLAQDMRVSPEGNTVYLADTGMLKFKSGAIIVFDIKNETTRTLLLDHPSVNPQDWYIRKQDGSPNRLAFGLLNFAVGVDGIALSRDGEWLYYGAINNNSMFRIRTGDLLNTSLDADALGNKVERVGPKPLSDGIELDGDNNVVITDVENGGIAMLTPKGELSTLARSPGINWSDSVTIAPNGDIYFTDSYLTGLMNSLLKPADHDTIKQKAPYTIYRIKR